MSTPHELALAELGRGMAPIPVPLNAKSKPGKNPDRDDWQDLCITEETAKQYFNGAAMNIGTLNGEPSGNYVDVDLDCSLACTLAKRLLPKTHARLWTPVPPGVALRLPAGGPRKGVRRGSSPAMA